MRPIDADTLIEEIESFFMTITGNPKPITVVRECKKSFAKIVEDQPTVFILETKAPPIDWEQEAKQQCAAAGELRIMLTERLEEVRTNIRETRKMFEAEDDADTAIRLQLKGMMLQREADWLESALQKKKEP